MIYNSIGDINNSKAFLCLEKFAEGNDVYLKIEGFNAAGSIKLKTAISMVQGLEERGAQYFIQSAGSPSITISLTQADKDHPYFAYLHQYFAKAFRD